MSIFGKLKRFICGAKKRDLAIAPASPAPAVPKIKVLIIGGRAEYPADFINAANLMMNVESNDELKMDRFEFYILNTYPFDMDESDAPADLVGPCEYITNDRIIKGDVCKIDYPLIGAPYEAIIMQNLPIYWPHYASADPCAEGQCECGTRDCAKEQRFDETCIGKLFSALNPKGLFAIQPFSSGLYFGAENSNLRAIINKIFRSHCTFGFYNTAGYTCRKYYRHAAIWTKYSNIIESPYMRLSTMEGSELANRYTVEHSMPILYYVYEKSLSEADVTKIWNMLPKGARQILGRAFDPAGVGIYNRLASGDLNIEFIKDDGHYLYVESALDACREAYYATLDGLANLFA